MTGASRKWIWILLLAFSVVLGLSRLRFDVEILNLLPGDSSVVQGLKLYQQNFSNARELIVVIDSPDAGRSEEIARKLADLLRADTKINSVVTWQPPWLENPEQSAELIAALWLNQSSNEVHSLTDRLAPDKLKSVLTDTRERLTTSFSAQDIGQLAYDPYGLTKLPESASAGVGAFGDGQRLFTSDDGRFRLMFVQAREDLSSYKACVNWFENMQKTVAKWRERESIPPEVRLLFTGRPAFVAEIGGGMERDMTAPSIGTLAVIALLFYATHRRLLPLVWLLVLLIGILAITLALGGLFFGALNVVSLGFASILLGLAEDFGIVLYQESRSHPELSIAQVRRMATPGIFWSAVTCSGAFLLLNLSGLPGLAQLGSLVAIGIIVAAVVMLVAYLPPLTRNRLKADAAHDALGRPTDTKSSKAIPAVGVWWLSGLTLALGAVLLTARPPTFDRSPTALRPKNSQAFAAIEEIKLRMGTPREPMWVMIEGRNELEVARRLASVEIGLRNAVSNQLIANYTLSSSLWPKPDSQMANRSALQSLVNRRDALLQSAAAEGFTDNALVMTRNILDVWQRAASSKNVFWPTNANSRWIFDKVFVQKPGDFLALGLLYPGTNHTVSPKHLLAALKAELPKDGVLISGWELLGPAMAEMVMDDLPLVFIPILGLVVLTLWLAFRSWPEVFLSLATQVFSFLLLAIIMSLADWKWNMMNLMALPLLLGMGVDFAIHTQLALHRYGGNSEAVRGSIGKALLLAGSTTVAGFAAIAFSSNAGMASLGRVCGVGISCALITAVFFLPVWWQRWIGRNFKSTHSIGAAEGAGTLSAPPPIYRAELWRLGLFLARTLPHHSIRRLARWGAGIYWICCPARREVVIENLLVPLQGDREAAIRHARELFREFAIKLADLWRYESGLPIDGMFGEWTGWSHFESAQAQKRGILLLTPHLGNWEFGAPILAQRGINLLVITLAEPHGPLTRLRQESRARWGIETLVIGQDPFAFVEVIRRLEGGAAVALLMDRPPASTALTVELFGQPFAASKAAAELARASGCVLLPVYLPRTARGYAAHILPEVSYDRAALRSPEERRKLTQAIMTAFAPAIKSHLSQWYHFVPIWPQAQRANPISKHH